MITAPNTPSPIDNFTTYSSVCINGVSLDLAYGREALTHVRVGAMGSLSAKGSWLGWAITDRPVTQADVMATGERLGRELLASINAEVLCVGAMEELRRLYHEHKQLETEARRRGDLQGLHFESGQALGLATALPLLEVIIDRVGTDFADRAHQPQRDRNAAKPQLTHAEGIAGIVNAIHDGIGDRADIRHMMVRPDGIETVDVGRAADTAIWDKIKDLVASAGLTISITDLPADSGPIKFMVYSPRARLMLDHAKAARDLGHSFPEMLTLSAHDLAVLEAAEDHSRRALLAITAAAKRNA